MVINFSKSLLTCPFGSLREISDLNRYQRLDLGLPRFWTFWIAFSVFVLISAFLKYASFDTGPSAQRLKRGGDPTYSNGYILGAERESL